MARSTDVTSFTEHRQHLREHFARVQETGRPLFVTTNGHTDAVVLSPAAFDALADKAELAESLLRLARSEDDIREGRTRNAKAALKELADDLGWNLEGRRGDVG